ncbi:hypothetical protein [Aquimarina sp. 2201CG5-10]|uniref:hypothetical protein n=1 Tax=Aquimarina callyspongiae TaxID=3098150 RepID=UPI002AB49DFE|nr:hypothetical protein [Aquimarina sp. 2201CG5-10]MDY8138631.1 hypothetical protein [Aquimarina sp. 2201CG5-10]
MTKTLLICFFITISFHGFSQSQILKGRIVADSIEGYAINIVNFTKEIGSTNDENGFFRISASVKDSIVFSSVQYEIKSIVITQEDLEKEVLEISLKPIVRQLEQVRVSNIGLTGNLSKDATVVELQPFVNNKNLGLPFGDIKQPTQAERKIYTAKSGILDRPINYLNGKLKKLKRIKALEDLDRLVEKGETTFNTAFFVEALKLPENLITDFMFFCAEDEYFKDLLGNSKRLTLVEFFEKKVIFYKEFKGIE